MDLSTIDFTIYHEHLDNLIAASKNMDEQTFRLTFDKEDDRMPFIFTLPINDDLFLYRARLARKIHSDEDLNCPQTFSYVPSSKITDTFPYLQRANYSGQSIFYASFFPITNFREISADVMAGEEVYLSKWYVSKGSNLSLYRVFPKESFDDSNYSGFLKVEDENLRSNEMGRYLRRLGELMMNCEDGDSKYLPTACIANYIYNVRLPVPSGMNIESLGFHGLIYPSTKESSGKELNLAISPSFIDKHAKLQIVWKGKVGEDLKSIKYSSIGFCNKGKIDWYSLTISPEDITLFDVFFYDAKDNKYDVSNGMLRDKNGMVISDKFAVCFDHYDEFIDAYLKEFGDSLYEMQLSEITGIDTFKERTIKHLIVKDLEDWSYEEGGENYKMVRVSYHIEVQAGLKRIDKI